MKALIVYGLSGAGKSTIAKEFVERGYVEVNRDNIRFSEIDPGGDWTTYKFTKTNEKKVTKIWNEQLASAAFESKDIVISDTLLSEEKRNKVVDSLLEYGYDITIVFLYFSLKELIARDASRGRFSVGESVLRKQWQTLYGGEDAEI